MYEIYEILQRGFPHAHLEKVRLEETMMNSFEYAGTASPGQLAKVAAERTLWHLIGGQIVVGRKAQDGSQIRTL